MTVQSHGIEGMKIVAGDFFGASFGDPATRSLLLGTKEGWSYVGFPMPFDRSARIELVSERGSGGPAVTIASEVVFEDRPREAAEGWFHAAWRRENPTPAGQPTLSQHFVALTADVPASGRYAVSAVGIAGPDAGIVQMLRDDQPVGEPIDFYAPRRVKTRALKLAELNLTRGPNHLFFALVGKNEKSTGKGFDLVEIHCTLAESGPLKPAR